MYNKNNTSTIAKKDYSFNIAYERLDKIAKKRVREMVCQTLGITENTFRVKKLGYCTITANQADVVRVAFNKEKISKVFNYEYAD